MNNGVCSRRVRLGVSVCVRRPGCDTSPPPDGYGPASVGSEVNLPRSLCVQAVGCTASGLGRYVASSVSGLLRSSAHVRQARSPRLRCRPGVAVITLGRPPHRARGGHTHRRRSPEGETIPRIFRIYEHFRRVRPHLAGDGPRPVRAGSGLPLGFCPECP